MGEIALWELGAISPAVLADRRRWGWELFRRYLLPITQMGTLRDRQGKQPAHCDPTREEEEPGLEP